MDLYDITLSARMTDPEHVTPDHLVLHTLDGQQTRLDISQGLLDWVQPDPTDGTVSMHFLAVPALTEQGLPSDKDLRGLSGAMLASVQVRSDVSDAAVQFAPVGCTLSQLDDVDQLHQAPVGIPYEGVQVSALDQDGNWLNVDDGRSDLDSLIISAKDRAAHQTPMLEPRSSELSR